MASRVRDRYGQLRHPPPGQRRAIAEGADEWSRVVASRLRTLGARARNQREGKGGDEPAGAQRESPPEDGDQCATRGVAGANIEDSSGFVHA